jgi:hypothetical protein
MLACHNNIGTQLFSCRDDQFEWRSEGYATDGSWLPNDVMGAPSISCDKRGANIVWMNYDEYYDDYLACFRRKNFNFDGTGQWSNLMTVGCATSVTVSGIRDFNNAGFSILTPWGNGLYHVYSYPFSDNNWDLKWGYTENADVYQNTSLVDGSQPPSTSSPQGNNGCVSYTGYNLPVKLQFKNFSLSTQGLQKSSALSTDDETQGKLKTYQRIVIQDSTRKSGISILLGNTALQTAMGEKGKKSVFTHQAAEKQETAEQFTLALDEETVTAKQMDFEVITKTKNWNENLTVSVELLDGNKKSRAKYQTISLKSADTLKHVHRLSCVLPSSGPKQEGSSLVVSIAGIDRSKYRVYSSTHMAIDDTTKNNTLKKEEDINLANQLAPTEIGMMKNYPNPFNPTTVISYQLSAVSNVKLTVYDMLGREVAKLVDGVKEAGYYTATFNASNLASGIYFARFTASPFNGDKPFVQTIKMLLTK